MSNSACNDTDRLGYPCCISAHCIMTQRNGGGELQYYPEDTPTFALFSIYDIYLMTPGLESVANLESVPETSNTGDGNGGFSIVLDFLRIIGEYGGTMNSTLDTVTTQVCLCKLVCEFLSVFCGHAELPEPGTVSMWGTDKIVSKGEGYIHLYGNIYIYLHQLCINKSTGLHHTISHYILLSYMPSMFDKCLPIENVH